MYAIDTTALAMVTGATGYVAGWIVKGLLQAGVTVHAPVRDPINPAKLQYLNAIAENSPGKLRLFKADLLDEGSYAQGMSDCSIVFHTASPFTINVRDPQKDLVDPALLGTRNVLEEANRTPSVKRVVLTSSCAAIYSDNADIKKTPNDVFTEKDWNTGSSLAHRAYSYSKTVAEREAWKIADAQKRWDLVVVNPSLVLGPGISPYATSESFTVVRRLGDGMLKRGVPRMGVGVVDVRDLAKAHLAAAYTQSAKGRHIISGHNTDLFELALTLLPKYGNDYPIPRKSLPKWLVWIVGPMVDAAVTRKIVSLNVGIPWRGDNSKSIRALDISYRPLADSLNDMFQQLIEAGQFDEV
ncbi:MAG: NAD-dependent epimerase/dehydratase family protein [Hyphomicrobiaceae bacterium]